MSRLELYYPAKPFFVFQNFGESEACTENTPSVPIAKRRVVAKVNGTCPMGYTELYPLLGMKGHTGIDLLADHNQILRSSVNGIVKEIQTEVERGLGVGVITSEKVDMGTSGFHYAKVRQWHLISISVNLNQRVMIGDEIGRADTTGLSSGDHDHFEVKPVEYMGDSHYNVFQNNGYFGAIDPKPFFNGKYAEDYLTHIFATDMHAGDESDEVKYLQRLLRKLGYFTFASDTGFYGNITRDAVYRFQLDNVNLSLYEKFIMKGYAVGPKTREALNKKVVG